MAKILVAEDEELVLETMQIMLEEGGHNVSCAVNGREALKKLHDDPFDLIVTDIIMPEIDGLELLTEVRQRFPNVKIIAVSGGGRLSANEYLHTANVLGADGVLPKPFAMADLIGAIEHVLAR